MAGNKQAIRTRTRSIQSTKKITSAMKMVSISKFARFKSMLLANQSYAQIITEVMRNIIRNADKKSLANPLLKESLGEKPLTIVFTSDLGLAGGYNINILRTVTENITPEEPIIVIGKKGYAQLKNKYNIINEVVSSDNITKEELTKFIEDAVEQYVNDEVSAVRVIYTEFVNTINFVPKLVQILPIEAEEEENLVKNNYLFFEPNAKEVLDKLIPLYLNSVILNYWVESKTSELGARRVAMDKATDSAEELIEKLLLEFNQARQAAITQEITEIVAGADAL